MIESALVDVPGMNEPREIDVLIETAIGPYHMKIAVEAKDNRRKLDSTQFESLVGKYFVEGGLKVNKVVIVTHNGFFNPVIQRAKQLGVELLTLSEAKDVDWSKFQPSIKPFQTFPRICDIEVSPPINDERFVQDGQVSCSHGTKFGNVKQFAWFILANNVFRNQQEKLRQLDKAAAADPEGKKGKIEYMPDHPHIIRLHDEEYPLAKLTFAVHFSKSNTPPLARKSEIHFQFAPHICKIEVSPPVEDSNSKELSCEGRLICSCCGKDHGTLNEYASKVVFEGVFQRQPEVVQQFQEAVQKSPNGQAWVNVDWKIDDKKVIRFREVDYPIDSINVGVHAISAKAPLSCKHYELTKTDGVGQLLSHFEGSAGGKKFSIVVPHAEGGHPDKIVLKVDNAKPLTSKDTSDQNGDDVVGDVR